MDSYLIVRYYNPLPPTTKYINYFIYYKNQTKVEKKVLSGLAVKSNTSAAVGFPLLHIVCTKKNSLKQYRKYFI